MTDVSFALEAKSDQLNAVDIMGGDRFIRITDVKVRKGDQPISVYFEGDHGRPWKPSKGMGRVLAAAWGTDSSAWIGRCAVLYFEPSVMYAGQAVGGIRVRALSDIPKQGLKLVLTINRQKREPYLVEYLSNERPSFPQDRFENGLPKMISMITSGEKTLQQVIAICQKTGDLTPEQLATLEQSIPREIDDSESPALTDDDEEL